MEPLASTTGPSPSACGIAGRQGWERRGRRLHGQQHTKDVVALIAALDADPSISWVTREEGIRFPGRPKLSRSRSQTRARRARRRAEGLEPSRLPKNQAIALRAPLRRGRRTHSPRRDRRGSGADRRRSHGPGGWAKLPEDGRQRRRDNAGTLIGQMREERAPFSPRGCGSNSGADATDGGRTLGPESFHRILDGLASALKDHRRAVVPAASHGSNADNPEVFPSGRCWRFLKAGEAPLFALPPQFRALPRSRPYDAFIRGRSTGATPANIKVQTVPSLDRAAPVVQPSARNVMWPSFAGHGTGDDPLLVELADDRPVFGRRQLQRRVPDRGHAWRNVGRLLAVEEHDVARKAGDRRAADPS